MTTIYVDSKDNLPDRIPYDEYRTPQPFVAAAMEHFAHHIWDRDFVVGSILDPSAGETGVWGLETKKIFGQTVDEHNAPYLYGVDIQDFPTPDGYNAWYGGIDFMEWNDPFRYDLIFTNPPYKGVHQFIERCWDHLHVDGYMGFLLRLNFQATARNYELFQKFNLTDILTSVQRIKWYGNGSNATEYGVFIFRKQVRKPGVLQARVHWLDWR